MAKNTICIWYDKDAEAAARFYAETFPDSAVGAVHRAPSDYPSGKEGDVLKVEFTVAGVPCLGLNGAIAAKKAGFRSMSDAWADTTTAHGRLMLTVLGGLAEFERELIRARTGEGRKLAKARGVKMGHRPKLTDHQKREALQRREAGEPTREIARSYNVSHSTISRLSA